MLPVFFIHIPKTAGTSFRLAAKAFFSADRIVCDYNKQSVETSDLVREFIYEPSFPDYWGFYRALEENSTSLLGGHVAATRFIDGVGADRSVTFLREPLQRMISEYAHFCRHNGYEDTFRAFFSRPAWHDRMSKLLKGVPLEALGVVGLTERYAESLALVNQLYDWSLEVREDNLAKERVCTPHSVDPADEALFYEQNAKDVALYERARRLFDMHVAISAAGYPYAHASLDAAQTNRVAGWAWWAGRRDDPVLVEICINEQPVATVHAAQLRPNLLRLKPPRGGHVGFSASVDAQVGDKVSCRVVETGQIFPPATVAVTEHKR